MDYSDLDELIAATESPSYIEFNQAAEYLKQHHDKLMPDDLLDLYAFYKQGTVGDCNISKPGIFQMQSRAKWNAWNEIKGMTVDDAIQKYVQKLSECIPNWKTNISNKGDGNSWVSVSRPQDFNIDESQTIIDFVQDGDLIQVQKFLHRLKGDEINELDEQGMGLIHWCTDRGHSDLLKVLLMHPGIRVNLQDEDGQTALHYSSSCGHLECLNLLLEANADQSVLDFESKTFLDVAFDESVLNLVKEFQSKSFLN